jgi:hypothetical protein
LWTTTSPEKLYPATLQPVFRAFDSHRCEDHEKTDGRSEQVLQQTMNLAFQRYREASKELTGLLDQVPLQTGSDAVMLLQEAGRKCSKAAEEYLEALSRYNEFVRKRSGSGE